MQPANHKIKTRRSLHQANPTRTIEQDLNNHKIQHSGRRLGRTPEDSLHVYQGFSLDLEDKNRSSKRQEKWGRRQNIDDVFGVGRKQAKNRGQTPLFQQSNFLPKISERGGSTRAPSRESSYRFTKQKDSGHRNMKVVSRLNQGQRKLLRMMLRDKFRKCVRGVMFLNRLQKKVQIKNENFQKMMKLSDSLLEIVDKMIYKYYANIIKIPLLVFSDNLKLKAHKPNADLSYNVVNNILTLSQGLKRTSIRKDLLNFLTLVTLDHARIPHDFFTQFQLLRLEFPERRFQILNMSQERVRMVVGFFLIIKILRNYIVRQPWNISFLEVPKQYSKKVQKIIWAYSSYLYYATVSFFADLQCRDEKFLQLLRNRGLEPVKIKEENSEFYEGVQENHPEEAIKIHENLGVWISRITSEVIKNRNNISFFA